MTCQCQVGGYPTATKDVLEHLAQSQRAQGKCGLAPDSIVRNCSTFWGSSKIEIASGDPGTIEWDTVGPYFDTFWPVAMLINVNSKGRNSSVDPATGAYVQTVREGVGLESLIEIEDISRQGRSWLAAPTPVNLETFRCCNMMVGMACLGPINVSSNKLEVSLRSVADPAAVTFNLEVSATLIGFEVRGGDVLLPSTSVPCGDLERGRVPAVPAVYRDRPAGTTPGGGSGGGGGGAWRPEG